MQNKTVEETLYLNPILVKRIEEVISSNPTLNFSMIINQALEEWLRQPKSINLARECFITDAAKGFGPTYKSGAL